MTNIQQSHKHFIPCEAAGHQRKVREKCETLDLEFTISFKWKRFQASEVQHPDLIAETFSSSVQYAHFCKNSLTYLAVAYAFCELCDWIVHSPILPTSQKPGESIYLQVLQALTSSQKCHSFTKASHKITQFITRPICTYIFLLYCIKQLVKLRKATGQSCSFLTLIRSET